MDAELDQFWYVPFPKSTSRRGTLAAVRGRLEDDRGVRRRPVIADGEIEPRALPPPTTTATGRETEKLPELSTT